MIESQTPLNESIIRRFAFLNQKGCLAHAYLFIGPEGIGKKETALAIAKSVNCENRKDKKESFFCDRCSACQRINLGSHPDVHCIEAQNEGVIKIEQIRELLDQVKLRPFEADKKIFIIQNVEFFTLEGANALLKTLEEPTQSSLLLLTTSVPERILDTVKSRCHTIYFVPFSQRSLMRRLSEFYKEDDLQSHFLAYFSEGCLGKAKKLKENKMFQWKNKIIDEFISSEVNEHFIKEILIDKDTTRKFLDILLSWVRDCLLIKAGVDDHHLVHRDRLHDLNRFHKRYFFNELLDLSDEIVRMFKFLSDNLNVKIPLLLISERLWAR